MLLLLCLGVEHTAAHGREPPPPMATPADMEQWASLQAPKTKGKPTPEQVRAALSPSLPPPAGCSSAPLAAPRAPALRLLRRAHLPRSRRRSRSARRWRSGPARSSRTSAASSVRAPPLLCVVCWLAARPCDRLCLCSAGVKDSELKKQLNKMMKEADAAKKAEVRASSQRPARIVRRAVLRTASARQRAPLTHAGASRRSRQRPPPRRRWTTRTSTRGCAPSSASPLSEPAGRSPLRLTCCRLARRAAGTARIA